MSLVTACPACATSFLVTPEQLSAHRGDVRCGQCQHIFNALQQLAEVTPAAMEAAAPVEEFAHRTQESAADDFEKTLVIPGPLKDVQDDEQDIETPEENIVTGFEESLIIAPMPADDEPPTPPPYEPVSNDAPETESTPDPDDGDHEMPALDTTTLDFELEPPEEAEIAPASGDHARETRQHAAADIEETAEAPATATSPPALPIRELLQDTAPGRSTSPWLLGMLALLFILIAAGQTAYFMRTEIAAYYPPSRVWLDQGCLFLNCTVELPRQADLLNIEDSDLLDDPDHAGVLVLVSALYNRAPYPQAYPLLELTLTDTFDKPVLRRTFKPQEYLPEGTNIAAGIATGGEIHSRLSLTVSGDKPAGYRLFVRY